MRLDKETRVRGPLSRFSIDAILNSKPSKRHDKLVRPWLLNAPDANKPSRDANERLHPHLLHQQHLYRLNKHPQSLLGESQERVFRIDPRLQGLFSHKCFHENVFKNRRFHFENDSYNNRSNKHNNSNISKNNNNHSSSNNINNNSNNSNNNNNNRNNQTSDNTPTNHHVHTEKPLNYPLQALFVMANGGLDAYPKASNSSSPDLSASYVGMTTKHHVIMRHLLKKHRKTRTAFSNEQLVQLEKRFKLQKYLTPADRDEIASSLKLSNSQVITWFQNRRAKLKRDMEELKADVRAATSLSVTLS